MENTLSASTIELYVFCINPLVWYKKKSDVDILCINQMKQLEINSSVQLIGPWEMWQWFWIYRIVAEALVMK